MHPVKAEQKVVISVIWNIIPYETLVIPAKAGIQSLDSAIPKVFGVDSRFRGNDCGHERPLLANDTATRKFLFLAKRWFDNIRSGKHVVVVVVSEHSGRHWVVTAYLARKLAEGVLEWKRS